MICANMGLQDGFPIKTMGSNFVNINLQVLLQFSNVQPYIDHSLYIAILVLSISIWMTCRQTMPSILIRLNKGKYAIMLKVNYWSHTLTIKVDKTYIIFYLTLQFFRRETILNDTFIYLWVTFIYLWVTLLFSSRTIGKIHPDI